MGTGDNLREARQRKLLSAAETLRARIGEAVLEMDDLIVDPRDGENFITEVKFRVRFDADGDVLGVMKRKGPEGKQIAFNTGDTIEECLRGFVSRMRNGSLKWREDKPYEER